MKRISLLVWMVLSLFLIVSCKPTEKDDEQKKEQKKEVAPEATMYPADGAENVAGDSNIVIIFDKAIRHLDDTAITNATVSSVIIFKKEDANGANVYFGATIDAAKKVITIDPSMNLDSKQKYFIQISKVESLEGVAIKTVEFSFTSKLTTVVSPIISPSDRSILLSTITNSYVDNWKGTHSVSSTTWLMGDSLFDITKIDTSADYMIAHNSATNKYNPGKYSRFDWVKDATGDRYYCQSAYNKESANSAEHDASADHTDLAHGCGGFGWSKLIPFTDVSGDYVDNYKGTHSISSTLWAMGESLFHLIKIDTSAGYMIAHNSKNNAYNPEKYSRFDWTRDATGDLFYCQIAYDKETKAKAEAVKTAEHGNLSNGCNGFGWSKLIPFTDVSGDYVDNAKGTHSVSSTLWVMGESLFAVTKIDTSDDYMVAHNSRNNASNPEKYSRFDWTDATGDLYYCQIAYDKDTSKEAEDTTADHHNLSTGCNGSSWSKLTHQNEVLGGYADNYHMAHTVSSTLWKIAGSDFNVTQMDVSADYLIAHNSKDNAWYGGKYSRFDWTKDATGDLFYCQIATKEDTTSDANAVSSAMHNNLTMGCNGRSWSKLIPFTDFQ